MNRNIFINLLCLTMCLFSASQSYAQQKTLSKTAVSIKQQGYVDVQDEDPTIKVSLMYSRPDNFTGKILYKDLKEAFLHPQAVIQKTVKTFGILLCLICVQCLKLESTATIHGKRH